MMHMSDREPTRSNPSADSGGCSVSATGRVTVIEVAPRSASLDRLRRILSDRLTGHVGGDRLQMFLVAVSEAVTNAIEAHRHRRIDAAVRVTIDHPRGLLTVEDHGAGPEPASLVALDPSQPAPTPDERRGRGLLIMRSICPDLDITRSAAGLRVTLPFPAPTDP
jgi:anti-sigma regulatory factor (Ser/Thr protein kinase)